MRKTRNSKALPDNGDWILEKARMAQAACKLLQAALSLQTEVHPLAALNELAACLAWLHHKSLIDACPCTHIVKSRNTAKIQDMMDCISFVLQPPSQQADAITGFLSSQRGRTHAAAAKSAWGMAFKQLCTEG
jgi:hypothetical protein